MNQEKFSRLNTVCTMYWSHHQNLVIFGWRTINIGHIGATQTLKARLTTEIWSYFYSKVTFSKLWCVLPEFCISSSIQNPYVCLMKDLF